MNSDTAFAVLSHRAVWVLLSVSKYTKLTGASVRRGNCNWYGLSYQRAKLIQNSDTYRISNTLLKIFIRRYAVNWDVWKPISKHNKFLCPSDCSVTNRAVVLPYSSFKRLAS